MDRLAWFYLETDDILLTIGYQFVNFLFRQSQRVTHLHTRRGIILEILYLVTFSIQFRRSVKRDICLIFIKQLLDIFFVNVPSLALAVRSTFSTERNAFVKLNSQPFERFQNILFSTWYKTVAVCIFYPEYQITAMLTGEQIIIQSGTDTADMKCPCRAWCKTHTNFSFGH